eukprot:12507550-Alexandrium_andersonii.AAC.1
MKVPTRMFLGSRGLANAVYLLEQQFGAEGQDMTRSALGKWEQFYRKKNQSMEDFMNDFDIILADASYYGLNLGDIGLSRAMLNKAKLNEEEERWVLLPAQGDYRRYHEIRRHLRRLPQRAAAREAYFQEEWAYPPRHDNISE